MSQNPVDPSEEGGGVGVDPSEGQRNVGASESNVDPSERGGSSGTHGGHGGHGPGSGEGGGKGGGQSQQKGGINPVQHSE